MRVLSHSVLTLHPFMQIVVQKKDGDLDQFWTYSVETLLPSMQTVALKEKKGLGQYWT